MSSPAAFFGVLSRGIEIVWSLSVYWSSLSLDLFMGRGEEMVPKRAEQLRCLLCNLGPSFIKAGQVLSASSKKCNCIWKQMNLIFSTSFRCLPTGQIL